jgi:hypothetical protein
VEQFHCWKLDSPLSRYREREIFLAASVVKRDAVLSIA